MLLDPKRAFLAVFVAAVAGCSQEAPATVRRSTSLPLFAPADSIVFSLGALGGSESRVVGVHALSDSAIAVITTAPGGVFIARLGSSVTPVSGAGALRAAHAATCTQGGLAIVTSGDRQVLLLQRDGALVSAGTLPPSFGPVLGLQCESAKDLVLLADGAMPPSAGASLVRVGSALLRAVGDGKTFTIDTLGTFSGRELLRLSPSDPGIEPPFGVTMRFAAGPTRLYIASTDESAITQLQTNGRELGAIEIVADARKVSRSTVDSAVRARLGSRLNVLPPAAVEQMIDALAKDRTAPRWVALAVDPGENVWLAPNAPPDNDGDRAWTIYRTDGARRARVFLPYDFEVTEIDADFVLGYMRSLPVSRATRMFKLQLLGG